MIKIVDCSTGEEIERTLTEVELKIAQEEQKIRVKLEKIQQEKDAPKLTAKAIAEGKLAALGLTTDDLRALGL